MGEDRAAANVTRSYSLAATSIAIFTFTLFFLYPRFVNGEANALLFQAAIIAMGVATFSFVFASFCYYCAASGIQIEDIDQARFSRRGDRFWLLGCMVLLLDPTLILFSVGLVVVGSVWFVLWLLYVGFIIRHFPMVQTPKEDQKSQD